MSCVLPAFVPLPMVNDQRSGITIGDPFVPFNVPRAVSLVRLKTLISPLPLLPTSKSPASEPNDVGAMASPHGWSSDPPVPTRERKFPDVLKASTIPDVPFS